MMEVAGDLRFDRELLICSLIFAANHIFSFLQHWREDRAGEPHILRLMLTPYARIVPMHITVVFGITPILSAFGVLVFGTLKTAADMLMHMIEHGPLRTAISGSKRPSVH